MITHNPNRTKYLRMLNLSDSATIDTIKRVTKELLHKYHPDKHPQHKTWAETQTKRILEAYQVLVKDAQKEMRMKRFTSSYPYSSATTVATSYSSRPQSPPIYRQPPPPPPPPQRPPIYTQPSAEQEEKVIYSHPHVKIIVRERIGYYMETVLLDRQNGPSIYFDIELVDRVVAMQQIHWVREPNWAKIRGLTYCFMNPHIFNAPHTPKADHNILLFKPVFANNFFLALSFVSGGKVTSIPETEAVDYTERRLDNVSLRYKEPSYYVSHKEFAGIQQFLLKRYKLG